MKIMHWPNVNYVFVAGCIFMGIGAYLLATRKKTIQVAVNLKLKALSASCKYLLHCPSLPLHKILTGHSSHLEDLFIR